ncbi:hypothetical protein [Nonomuraea salmonea]
MAEIALAELRRLTRQHEREIMARLAERVTEEYERLCAALETIGAE